MATAKWGAPGSSTTILSTGLNALASGSLATSSTTSIDNATALAVYADVEVNLASFTPGTGPYVDICFYYSYDGTNFEDQSVARTDCVVASPQMTTGASVKRIARMNIPIAPFKFYVGLVNRSGAALAATGNTVLIRTHNGDVT